MRKRQRIAVGSLAGALVLALLATWVLLTEVGTPADAYATTPDACTMLSEDVLDEFMRNPDPPRPSGVSTWRRAGLRPPPEIDHCAVSSEPWQDGEVRIEFVSMWVHRFKSTQLYLGPSGKRLAEERYEHARHVMDPEGRGCAYERHGPDGSACALHTDDGFDLHAQRGNLYTHILARTHEPLPDELLARLADEVLTRLDSVVT
jgi:hypothetical protein